MKLKQFPLTPYLPLDKREFLDSIKPWSKDYWDSSAVVNGVDIKNTIKEIKTSIKDSLNDVGLNTCTYCGSALGVTSDEHLDHFAPKYKHPQFTFELNNLFIACTKCNLSTRKGKKLTVNKLHVKYAKCKFRIVHPHFDNPEKHLAYILNDDRKIIIQWLTRKGKKTIKFFKLNEPQVTIDRAKTYLYDTVPLPDQYQALYERLFNEKRIRI